MRLHFHDDPIADRLTSMQLRLALAACGMTAYRLASEIERNVETVRRPMRAGAKNPYLSPRLSTAVRDYFTARGLRFVTIDGQPGVLGPRPG